MDMRKNAKRLTLSKETLRNLEPDRMDGIEGGAPPTRRADCTVSKEYSLCETCGIACTIDCTF
jgi:hypothetical protein